MAKGDLSITALLGLDSSGLEEGISASEKQMGAFKEMAKAVGEALWNAFKRGTEAIVRFGAASIKSFGDFEKGMNEVNTLLGDGVDISAFQNDLLKLSDEIGKSTKDLVPALYSALSLGVAKEDALDFLRTANKLGTAGVGSVSDGVDVLRTVMNGYGLSAKDATKISDILFGTIAVGSTTLKELTANIGKVTPSASALGVDFEQVGAMMAAMTLKLGKGSTAEAATKLKVMLDELGKAGSGADKAFRGVSGGVGFRDFVKAGGTMQGGLKLMGDAARAAGGDIADMFGSAEAGMAARIINSKIYAGTLESVGDAAKSGGKTTNTAFDKMDKGVNRSMEKWDVALENFSIRIGKALSPILEALEPAIKAISKAFQEFPFDKLGALIDEFVEAAKPIVEDIFGSGSKGVFDLILSWVKMILDGVLLILKVVRALKPVLILLGGILKAIYGTLSFVFNLLGAIFDLLAGDIDGAERAIKKAFKALSDAFGDLLLQLGVFVVKFLKNIWDGWVGLLKHLWDEIKTLGKNIWDFAGEWLTNFGEILLAPFKGLWKYIKQFFGWFDTTFSVITKPIKAFLNFVWDMIKTILGGLESLIGPIKAGAKWLDDTFGFLLEDVKEISAESARATAAANRARAARSKDAAHQKYLDDKKRYLDKIARQEADASRVEKEKERIKDIATINNLRNKNFDTIAMSFGLGPGQLKAAILGKGDDRTKAFWKALSPDVQRLLVEKLRSAENQGRNIRVTDKGMFEEGSKEWVKRIQQGRTMAANQGLTNQMGVALMRKLGIKSWNDLFLEVGAGRTDVDKLITQAFGENVAKQFNTALAANKREAGKVLLQQTGIIKTPQQEALEKQQRAMQNKIAQNMMQNPMMQRQMMQNMYQQMMFMKGQGGAGTNLIGRSAQHLECACRHLQNIDRTTRAIDHTLRGKFVNQ